MIVKNFAPESDTIVLDSEHDMVTIERDESGVVYVTILSDDDSEMRLILGKEGHTQKL